MARRAARTGDKYDELRAKAAQYASKQDWRKAAKSLREAIALRPEKAAAYSNLGAMLCNSGHLEVGDTWKLGPRLAAEVWEAATHYKRAVGKAEYARGADRCRAACSVVHSRDVVWRGLSSEGGCLHPS